MTERKPLTVSELREWLAAEPPNAEVWIDDDSNRHFSAPVVGSIGVHIDGRVYLFPSE